ncbi:MAG: alanine--tRNA ligase [Elusimicrobia bacterium]|nr:alanine--tRNA ligase [Elusimicrobiota bacterium]
MSRLREDFLKYFDRRGHLVCASTPIVPQGDPTLLFTSAGMVPFKPYFLGIKSGLSRTASCQKCFRTTDIDRVGTTIRHLTFFEMLGNFSFGDYFKADAIHWAWEFLTKEMQLDPKRLYPTVFKDDDEAVELWKKEGTPNPITKLGEDTNFWNMGPTGPCGPCSEIYIDLGKELSCGKPSCGVGCDCDRYLEIWNLVFTQFDRQPDGSLKGLPQKNIDTGMGLERLALAVSGKRSPFETELFWPIMESAAELLGTIPGKTPQTKLAFRIIGDHARAASVLASEGIIPSNVERGYVLRRLIRRAVRYGQLLGRKEPFLHKLVPSVLEVLGATYPDLAKAKPQIEQTILAEETRFMETLEKGERELETILADKPTSLPGEAAFKLYDTFGFPFELTKEIALGRGIAIDEAGFAAAQEKASEVARAGWKGSGEVSQSEYEKVIKANAGLHCEFTGYGVLAQESRVAAVLRLTKGDGGLSISFGATEELKPGDEGEVVLFKTSFYPEGGGQVGDKGALFDDIGKKIADVHDTQRPHPDLIVHRVTALRLIRAGFKVRAEVDKERRETIRYHHTATHLLNAALREVLGDTVRQAGSLVAPDKLRFDFTHAKPMTPDQIKAVEESVNKAIKADMPVEPQERPAKDVDSLGAVKLLGESYGEKPRFLLIGPKGWITPMDRYSLELCGGTHVHHTGEIQHLKIVKETSVAAGIRRIEAVAGPALEEHQRQVEEGQRTALRQSLITYLKITAEIMEITGKPHKSLPSKIADPDAAPIEEVRRSTEAMKELEKMLKSELGNLRQQSLSQQAQLGKVLMDVGRIKLCVQKFRQAEIATLRQVADQVKREMGTGVVFMGSSDDNKLSFVVSVTQDLVGKGLDASALAKTVAGRINGRAGGRADFAQGGGNDYDWNVLVQTVTDSLRPLSDKVIKSNN